MRALTQFRFPLLALGLAFTLGCSADSPNSPTAPPSNPIPPAVGINVSVTSSSATLEAGSTDFATLIIRATRADNGQPVANLTPGTITTTLGTFGSAGGPQELAIELVNGQATVVLFAGTTIGAASIRAAVSSGVGFTSISIREPGVPDTFFLSSVSPSTGSPQGGDIVTINGGGFSDPIRVTFGNVPAVIQSASATQIRVTTPRCPDAACFETGAITAVTVSVTVNLNEEDQASDSLGNGFSYVNGGGGGGTLQPSIFSVTPSSGPNEGGTQVTINGDGFEAPVAVDFGEGDGGPFVAAQVLSVTRTRIVVLSPAATGFGQGNLNRLVDIRVTNQNSGRTALAASSFRYGVSIRITALGPTEGPPEGGTIVTIFGQGFDSPVAVSLAGRGQQVISVSGTEIVVRTVPIVITSCANATGGTSVTNIESGDTATSPVQFTYILPRPSIANISPFAGPQTGNTLVTISGSNFATPVNVSFKVGTSSFSGVVQSSTSTSINVRTPAIPDTVLAEEACEVNGVPPEGTRYIPTLADLTVSDPATGCSTTLPGVFTYNPTNTTCRGD